MQNLFDLLSQLRKCYFKHQCHAGIVQSMYRKQCSKRVGLLQISASFYLLCVLKLYLGATVVDLEHIVTDAVQI